MDLRTQTSYLHCSNPDCKWKVRYRGEWKSHPDFCPKCGWLAFYHCPNCTPPYGSKAADIRDPEPLLFENGICRTCRAQSKKYYVTFLRRLLDELATASGFVAKDRMTYVKELDTSPETLPIRMQERFVDAEEHRQTILDFYRRDCRLDLEEVTLFLRTTLDNIEQNKRGTHD